MAAPVAAATAGACPAYPWPQDGGQRGQKVFMQSDCAACHSALPYAGHGLREAAQSGGGEARVAEILVVEDARPAVAAGPLNAGAYQPDLAQITKIHEELRYNLYTAGGATVVPRMLAGGATVCQELKKRMAPPSPAWLQFLQPYTRTFQTA